MLEFYLSWKILLIKELSISIYFNNVALIVQVFDGIKFEMIMYST